MKAKSEESRGIKRDQEGEGEGEEQQGGTREGDISREQRRNDICLALVCPALICCAVSCSTVLLGALRARR